MKGEHYPDLSMIERKQLAALSHQLENQNIEIINQLRIISRTVIKIEHKLGDNNGD